MTSAIAKVGSACGINCGATMIREKTSNGEAIS
jgi:hypothetical protein